MGATTRRRRRLALALVLTAPLVAEFVSGNLPIIYVWLLVIYAPLYGGGALLIREIGRRSARPWPVIVTLGLVYGVFEESLVSFSLFNRNYADLELLEFGWISALGIGAWWTVFVVVLHAVWSVCVPIVLVEAFAGELTDQPWLRRRGLIAAGAALLLGAATAAAITVSEDSFVPSAGQLTGAAVCVAALIATALLLARRRPAPRPPSARRAPQPRTLVIVSAVAGFAFVAGAAQSGPVVVTLFGYGLLFAVAGVAVSRWSRRDGWGARSRLALGTGLLIPHVTFALLQGSLVDIPEWVGVGGELVFSAGLIAVLVKAWTFSGATPAVASQ